MKTFLAPNGKVIYVPEGRVITYRLTKEQNTSVKSALPSREYELYVADVASDVITISGGAVIINADKSDSEDVELFIDYLSEVQKGINQTIIWISKSKPPKEVERLVKFYNEFEGAAGELKYILLSAFKTSKRINDFSKKMADCLRILSFIRSNPGIRTQELSQKLEIPQRAVQRYISTLQASGEWIEYDTAKRGWKLQYGVSILFGDHLNL